MKKILSLLLLAILSLLFGITAKASTESITGPDVIYKQKDKFLTLSQILDLYSSNDGEVYAVNDSYTGYGDIPGIYDIVLGVQGTQIQRTITISVRNTIGNVIAVTNTDGAIAIHVYKNVTLTHQQIIDILVNIQYVSLTSTTQTQTITNSYTENANAPGNYVYEFRLMTTSGYENVYNITIKVSNSDELLPDSIYLPPESAGINGGNAAYILMAVVFASLVIYVFYKLFRKK